MKITSMEGYKSADDLIAAKHREYVRKARWFAILYYVTRLSAGLSAALLPFAVRSSVDWATVFSVVIVVTTILDLTFAPKDRWITNSNATDQLAIARLKAQGQYEQNKLSLDIIAHTEAVNLQRLADLADVVEKPGPKTS